MNMIELYILCGDRSLEIACKFLDKFTPDRKALAKDYYFPQYSDEPTYILKNDIDIIKMLTSFTNEPYSLYWAGHNGCIDESMLFFTKDGGMIAGVVIDYSMATKDFFIEFFNCVLGKFGYIDFECDPPDFTHEFIKKCEDSTLIKLINGEVFLATDVPSP